MSTPTSGSFRNFAIAGAGRLGKLLAEALAAHPGVTVVILSRSINMDGGPLAGAQVLNLSNVKVEHGIDYAQTEKLSAVFERNKIEVVISTLGEKAINDQLLIADACCYNRLKKNDDNPNANTVKLFVPSEFGFATDKVPDGTQGLMGDKKRLADYVKELGLACTTFYNGCWTGNIPALTGYSENGKVNIVGNGQAPVAFTAIEDVVGFAAHALTTLPLSKLNRTIRFQGARSTLVEVADIMGWPVAYVDAVPGPESAVYTGLMKSMEDGLGDIVVLRHSDHAGDTSAVAYDDVDEQGLSNGLWEGHHWQGIKESLQKGNQVMP